jgi:hypothetical protein
MRLISKESASGANLLFLTSKIGPLDIRLAGPGIAALPIKAPRPLGFRYRLERALKFTVDCKMMQQYYSHSQAGISLLRTFLLSKRVPH